MSIKIIDKICENMRVLEANDRESRIDGKLVGRYVREQIADGFAFYKIVKANKKTVVIKRVVDIGDDWSVPYWGNKATVSRALAEGNILRRDTINLMFGLIKRGDK